MGQYITSFSPAYGAPGVSVTIIGANFYNVTAVQFGGVNAIYTVNSTMSISATVPLAAINGPVSVTANTYTVSSQNYFLTSPAISSFTPVNGTAGTQVYVYGINFISGYTAVYFGGIAGTSVIVTGEGAGSLLSVNVPSGATNAPIIVSTYTAGLALIGTNASADSFVVGNGAFIQSFSPTFGKPGDPPVVIQGNNFNNVTGVQFNGVSASYTVTGVGSQISANIPASATTGPITVMTTTGNNTTTTNFVVTSGPIVTGFSPTNGPVGTTVTINGANFLGLTNLTFNGVSANARVIAPSQISATVPSGATTGPITINTTNGTVTTTASFTVGAAPTISDFAPVGGPVGTTVTINGANFLGLTNLTFNGVSANAQATSATQISATVPPNATTGPITINTTNGTVTTSTSFLVGAVPAVSDFEPAVGGPGAQVVINGQNFINGYTTVQFNGVNASATVTSASQITATVPAGATTGPITVATPIGTNTTSTNFFVTPSIAGFYPTNGVAGSSITITGLNFTAAIAVKFGSANAAGFTVNSTSNITAVVPAAAVSDTISVTTPAGIVATSTNFHVLPVIISMVPGSGAWGTSVAIGGAGFFNLVSVKFNGVSASYTLNSLSSLTATVPTGATTGPLVVTTSEGSATNAANFVVIPGISDFTPKRGAAGTNVVITGTRFGQVTNVQFNGVSAAFTINFPTQISATVPANASTGPITVTDAQGTAVSAVNFEVFPTLYILSLTNNAVLISWPVTASDYTLAVSTNLGAGATWSVATNISGTVGDQIRATNELSTNNLFFRLQK